MAINKEKTKKNKSYPNSSASGLYFVGFIGAAVYYIQATDGFWNIILALLKACVWPAFVVHKILGL